MTDTEYRSIKTHVPPALRERDGQWYIVLAAGSLEMEAPLSDYTLREITNRILFPRLERSTK